MEFRIYPEPRIFIRLQSRLRVQLLLVRGRSRRKKVEVTRHPHRCGSFSNDNLVITGDRPQAAALEHCILCILHMHNEILVTIGLASPGHARDRSMPDRWLNGGLKMLYLQRILDL
ncbi:hypothetical protein EVAR_69004_1 [Eumeta japonica]|uniref:Uncharacterized protein n=1 Tax=Eumeta variegata TaxID=151549 RepID=A0A4C1SMJ8_EUMVA|nr:hypothetical protein EVAR_69004_1 [Eumeta japonica]